MNKKLRLITAVAAFALSFAVKLIGVPWWVEMILFGATYLFIGYDVLWRAIRNILHGRVFDENFLMTIASLGAFVVGDFAESAAVMVFYQIGEYFQDYAVDKSRERISSLMDIRPDKAFVFENGSVREYQPEDVSVGAELVVKNGEKIPLDGVLLSDDAILDTAALTGESLPVNLKKGDSCLSGSINVGGVIHVRAEKEYYDSTVGKILDMVESASGKKAQPEKFITKFARYYTPIVVISAVLLAIIPPIFTGQWKEWIMRALAFLVVSCPCALVISVPLSFFGGIGGASGKGILIKGGSYLEQLKKVNTFVFDKTGTLTKGKFAVTEVFPAERRKEILVKAAAAESGSNHPIAKCITETARSEFDADFSDGYEIKEIAGKGIRAESKDSVILCGNKELMDGEGISVIGRDAVGSVVYVAENGKYLGCVVVEDELKSEAAEVISELKRQGVRTIMLTGDNEAAAAAVAKKVGIDEYRSGLLPTDKVAEVERLIESKKEGDVIAFVGDGINDAPVLMRADVGVSMGGVGSDSAIEASDVVLMYDNLKALVEARKISVKTMRIVKQNIVFALAVKIIVLILSAFGITNMWGAVFADVGVCIIAILNAMRCMKTDRRS